ncbi:hypothetical protein [Thermus caldifontis]|uniref:hypothetical protein n=1 Tax=Thermus caldifontis TaxID=1930763 RepID=UPI000DF1D2EC|nr:hypothetical protein [Thermus caldifontis]
MATTSFRPWLIVATFLYPAALGQPLLLAHEPEVRWLFALELMRAALEAHAEAPSPDSLQDFEEGLHLVRESLRAWSLPFSSRWEGFLQRVEHLSLAEPSNLRPLLREAEDLFHQIQASLVPHLDPALRAGLVVQLALGDKGVAASYQEGFLGRKAAYRRGFFLLWQLELQVAELKPFLSPETWSRIAEALAALRELYPSSGWPERFRDPERAREAALDLAFALEAGLGVDLLPRDPRQGLRYLRHLVQPACQAPPGQGEEAWEAARLFFRSYLLLPLAANAPTQADALAQALDEPPSCDRLPALLQEAEEAPWE